MNDLHFELEPQIFGARIIETDGASVERWWQYDSMVVALFAWLEWDRETQEEPAGWVRAHALPGQQGLRRRPDGDPEREYVAP